jgi:hypothetical protein
VMHEAMNYSPLPIFPVSSLLSTFRPFTDTIRRPRINLPLNNPIIHCRQPLFFS